MGLCTVDLSALGNYQVVADVGHLPTGAGRYVGVLVAQADTRQLKMWDGTQWRVVTEPRQTWSVTTITQAATNVTGTTTRGWYQRFHDAFHAHLYFVASSAGAAGGTIAVPSPLTLVNSEDVGGTAVFRTVGGTSYASTIFPINTTTFGMVTGTTANYLGASPSLTIASGDQIRVDFWGSIS